MEKKMMMPANYNVMTEEEMTYTQGGTSDEEIAAAYAFVGVYYAVAAVAGVAALANYCWGLAVSRNWISDNKEVNGEKKSFGELISAGMDDLSDYMGKSVKNAIVGGATAFNVASLSLAGLFPVTAIAWLTA